MKNVSLDLVFALFLEANRVATETTGEMQYNDKRLLCWLFFKQKTTVLNVIVHGFWVQIRDLQIQCFCLKAAVDNIASFCLLTGSDVSFGKHTQLLWEHYQLRPLNSVNQYSWNRPTVCPLTTQTSAVILGKSLVQKPVKISCTILK